MIRRIVMPAAPLTEASAPRDDTITSMVTRDGSQRGHVARQSQVDQPRRELRIETPSTTVEDPRH